MAVLAKMNHQQWKQVKTHTHTHTHTQNPTQSKTKPKGKWTSRERDRGVTGNVCLVTYSALNTLLTAWTRPQESWSENTLLNNVILIFFNENLWVCSFFSLLQIMVVHLPVKQVFTHQKFLWILGGVLHFTSLLNSCPTRINDCQSKDYLYLCFPTIYYSGHPKSVGTFMWMPSYKSCPSPLNDSKGKKHTTIMHRTEHNKSEQCFKTGMIPLNCFPPYEKERRVSLSLFV